MTVLPGVATLGLVPVPFQSASSSCEREGRGEAKEAARVPIAIALCAAQDGKTMRAATTILTALSMK